MNYIQYMKPGGTAENKKETSKFIGWLNKAGKSWKDFWDAPVTIQYAYNPHAVVGNGGTPFSTTLRRGDFAKLTAAAVAIPATATGVATVGVVPTLVGMGAGMGAGIAADVGGSKLVELAGGDENALEMVGDIAGFTLGALAGGKATKVSTNYLNLWNSLLSPKSIYTSIAEGLTPTTTQNYGLVKYYGPTMGKTTAARTNPKLVDFDDVVRGPIAELAAKKGVTPRDLKIANDPDYVSLLEAEVARWRMNPANAGKTLVISNKALSTSTTGYNNLPSIPDKLTFVARQVLRGGTSEEAAAYYDALIENNPNLKIDNRFVSDIESGTRAAKISEAERLGIPKSERTNYLVGTNADPSYYASLGLKNPLYTLKLRDFHWQSSTIDNKLPISDVYHGYKNPFYQIDLSKSGGYKGGYSGAYGHGFYTSPNYRTAQSYGHDQLNYTFDPNRVYTLKAYSNKEPLYITEIENILQNSNLKNYGEVGRFFNEMNTYPFIFKTKSLHPHFSGIFQSANKSPMDFKSLMLASRLFNKSRGFKHNVWDLSDENLKLSDAITIDDMGSIVPLSQRDNFLVNDIRYKSGGTIKIKKKNIGSFTRYCNGKVTEECIRKGKNSSNHTTRKRANFAANARKWKHELGGKINYLNYFR